MTPEERAADLKKRGWVSGPYTDLALSQVADAIRAAASEARALALEEAAQHTLADGDWGHARYFADRIRERPLSFLTASHEQMNRERRAAEERSASLEKLLLCATTLQCPDCRMSVSIEWGPNDLRMIAPHVKHGVHGYVDPCPSSRTVILPALQGASRAEPGAAAPEAPKK